jgi:hypothetical protein
MKSLENNEPLTAVLQKRGFRASMTGSTKFKFCTSNEV